LFFEDNQTVMSTEKNNNCYKEIKRHHEPETTKHPHEDSGVRKKIKNETPYETIRIQLHLSSVSSMELVGRTTELAQVTAFFEEHLKQQKAGSLYISGPPGTGKTHLISYFLDQLRKSRRTKILYINCMKLSNSLDVYLEMMRQWNVSTDEPSRLPNSDNFKELLIELERLVIPERKNSNISMFILVLDEIDQLKTNVLYQIFAWTTKSNSLLLLIGIANSIELTERLLPRLRSKKIHVELLHFKPYTTEQIIAIVQQRLACDREQHQCQLFEENAITLLAKKIASFSGDIRKALDVCELALSMAESDSRKQSGAIVKVSITYMAKALDQAFASPVIQQIRKLPNHQKIILCALYQLKNSPRISVSQVRTLYLTLCESLGIDGLPISEFNEIIQTLPGCGLISIEKKGREHRVSLLVPESDLIYALYDDPLPLQNFFPAVSSESVK